jgi:two-component sensor histidine kinase
MVEKELEANQIRIRSIKQFYNAIYKHLNRIDFAQSIKEILKEFDSDVNSKKFAEEAIKDYPAFQNTYDMHKIIKILQAEISLLMKYYD